jgi:hypothetical protein
MFGWSRGGDEARDLGVLLPARYDEVPRGWSKKEEKESSSVLLSEKVLEKSY